MRRSILTWATVLGLSVSYPVPARGGPFNPDSYTSVVPRDSTSGASLASGLGNPSASIVSGLAPAGISPVGALVSGTGDSGADMPGLEREKHPDPKNGDRDSSSTGTRSGNGTVEPRAAGPRSTRVDAIEAKGEDDGGHPTNDDPFHLSSIDLFKSGAGLTDRPAALVASPEAIADGIDQGAGAIDSAGDSRSRAWRVIAIAVPGFSIFVLVASVLSLAYTGRRLARAAKVRTRPVHALVAGYQRPAFPATQR
jgi:hypothetical protein